MRGIFMACAVALAGPVAADPVRLTAAEIADLVSGRTAVGQWADDVYRQYFGPDGETFYAVKGKRTTRGKWRVNSASDQYESWWPRGGWAGYVIERDGETLEWVTSQGVRWPFTMEDGQQLLWE